ncbi:hypothetical protein CMI37_09780 [Candidatus Pacearchaeota archaeon]|jgi:hypothetical protein|nr:hypothetical protein [Candidatus Pacearchaeota archaeon]|tara:strand:- start:1482 stop:2045 length:564 start_codon:yes stop_codon:yes gene_type:complete
MIHFYKPTPKVTGTACSFYLNKRDNAFFSTLIKQDGWNSERRIGSFKKNKDNPSKRVNIKFSALEVASIIDSIKRNQKFTGYHGSNQIVRFTFGPYVRKGEQEQRGFSFSVTKENKEDSTDKASFLIGFNFGEAELLQQHLSHLLSDSFKITDELIEKSFKQNVTHSAPDRSPVEASELSDEEDDLW